MATIGKTSPWLSKLDRGLRHQLRATRTLADSSSDGAQVLGDGPSLDSPYAPRGPRSQVAEPRNVLRCAPAAIAPVESVQPEHAVDGVQFGRLDQFGVRDGNRKQRAFELCFPEREEVL